MSRGRVLDETSIESRRGGEPGLPDLVRCRYCGSKLNPFFYFCVACGTPYKDISAVSLEPSPPVMGEADLIERKAPGAAPLFWTYFAVILGGGVLTLFTFQEDRPDLALLLQELLLLVTTAVFTVTYWPTLWAQFRRMGFDRPEAWLALLALAPLLGLNYLQYRFFTLFEDVIGHDMILTQLRDQGYGSMALILMFCAFPAVTEEIAFRGLLQHWLQVAIKPWRALVLASFLFALVHFSILTLPYLFLVGMLLGWSKWKTGSLYPAMVIHFLHNFVVIEFFVPIG